MSLVQRITMTDAKVKFGQLSLNNQYQVHFAGFNSTIQNYVRNNLGILNADDFISDLHDGEAEDEPQSERRGNDHQV